MATVTDLAPRLRHVRDPSQILALLRDPRNDRVQSQKSLLLYTDPKTGEQVLFNGLVKVLAKTFWSDDEEETRKKSLEQEKQRAKTAAKLRVRSTARAGLGGLPTSLSHAKGKGSKGHFARGLIAGARAHEQFEDAHVIDPQSFERKYGSMSLDTRAFFEFYDTHGIINIAAEFCDYDEELQIAVRHDSVGVMTDGTVVFTEHKTGSKNCFAAASGVPLNGVLAGVLADSELTRALLQLAVSVLITLRQRPYIQRFKAYVVRPTDEVYKGEFRPKVYPLSEDFLKAYGGQIYAQLVEHRRAEGKLWSQRGKGLKRASSNPSIALFDLNPRDNSRRRLSTGPKR